MLHRSHYPAHIWLKETLTHHFYQSKINQYSDFAPFSPIMLKFRLWSLLDHLRSGISSQAHKYHILLTFICWQTDLKYRSTISVIITCNGNNRCGAEQRFWSGLQVWSFFVRLCEFSRAERPACCNHPDRTVLKMNIATFVWVGVLRTWQGVDA